MRSIVLGVLFLATSVLSIAAVTLNVYESDGITPFNFHYICVGTELKLVVSSDANDLWSGGVFLDDASRSYGALFGYGWDPNSRDWVDSHMPDAGTEAYVFDWEDSQIEGFDLFTSTEEDSSPGDWFVIDYVALEPGEPNIAFYEYNVSWGEPNEIFFLHQVPEADFNTDGIVNLPDFLLLTQYWLEQDCSDPNCQAADLDGDDLVDVNDLMLFTDVWMWGVPESSSGEQNENQAEPDPNLIYSVVDANGLNDITMTIGESRTLYVDLESVDVNDVWAFDVEINISDPNLGAINNTAYDPNNPPGEGTARILADPNRWETFDRWGPGRLQPDGIYLSGVGFDAGFYNGHLASFEYTCQSAGDVVLSLYNWDSTSLSGEKLHPTLKTITIHQGDLLEGESMTMSSMSMESTTTSEETTTSMSPEEMVQFLEDLWSDDPEVRNTFDKKEWDDFIKSVEQSYQQQN